MKSETRNLKPEVRILFFIFCFLFSGCWLLHPAFADTLCPEGEAVRGDAPSDMVGVQADIERLTLCVERARLLKQLDDVAHDRQAILDKMTNPGGNFSTGLGMPMGQGVTGIPALPISALPPLSTGNTNGTEGLKPGEVRVTGPGGSPLDAALRNTLQTLGTPEWKVRKIWGQGPSGGGGGAMRAQLSDGRGTLINVVKGDPLPDGAVVESVSVKGVTLSQNSKINDLSWEDASTSANTSVSKTVYKSSSVSSSNSPSGFSSPARAAP